MTNKVFTTPIENRILKLLIFGVVIHLEMQNNILRPMVKDLAQLELPFLSYGQIIVYFSYSLESVKNLQLFDHNSKTVSSIELIPSP